MKRIIAIIAVFMLGALVTGYVALAPNASSSGGILALLDDAAAGLIAPWGRVVAVRGLLGLTVVLSLLIAVFPIGRASAKPYAPPKARKQPKREREKPGPVWRVEPVAEDRIANLRRRALAEVDEEPVPPSMPPPQPVILVRKARERDRDWFDDGSWLGGLPRLGGAQWPSDPAGVPLPFVAQIDMTELSAAYPENPLPRAGSLAFFLGTGAVIAVPPGQHPFSEPPPGLPPAFDEGGCPFPAAPNHLSRHFFPFWPIDPIALDLPEQLRDHRDSSRDDAIETAMADLLAQRVSPSSRVFTVDCDMLWWHGVSHLADRLRLALDESARLVALAQEDVKRAEDTLHLIDDEDQDSDPAIASAREHVARQRETLAAIETQIRDLPDMIAALDQFATGRDPWQALTVEECSVMEDVLAELQASYADVVRHHAPPTTAELATLSVRAMITGTPRALAALPEDQLAVINRDCRLPATHQHQMFGLGGRLQSARDDHRADILLLQIGYDDLMEWRWRDGGLFQFWINPEDAAVGNWDAAMLTFEGT